MYSKVIVPLDGSQLAEQALPYAQLVAKGMSIPIELVEAFDVLPPAVRNRSSMMALDQMLKEARRRAEAYLSGVRNKMKATGCDVATAAVAGVPEQALVTRAGADPNALVAMTTHGRGGIARWALGSVTDKLLHTVLNPMLIVKATAAPAPQVAIRTVLAPLDGSDLAESALPHAAGLAAGLGARVVLARVSPTSDYYSKLIGAGTVRMLSSSDFSKEWCDQQAQTDSEEAIDYLIRVQRRLTAEYPDQCPVGVLHLPRDSVAEAIIQQVSDHQTLVVMNTHGRGGLGRMLLGSVTDRVVRHSDAPVLVVRDGNSHCNGVHR